MSHEITKTDNLFTVRDPAWHKFGHVFEDYPTREEAQQIAHPWEPVVSPVFAQIKGEERGRITSTGFREVDGYQAMSRSDNGAIIGVVSNTYEPVTNNAMYDIAEAIEGGDPSAVRYETGGSLKGGAKVWLLLRLAEPLLVKGDPNGAVVPYYALQNAFDGSGSFRGQSTFTRIVCDNTAQAADLDAKARGTEFVFHHTKNVKSRIEEARAALAGWRNSVTEWQRLSEHLIGLRITPEQRNNYVERFIPEPPPALASDRVRANVEAARSELLYVMSSPTCADIDLTAYGLVQASIEYIQHYRKAKSDESRFKRAYLDRSVLTADAVRLAEMAAHS
jgi:phage/plasmid-like protein (TIGR03299 family)